MSAKFYQMQQRKNITGVLLSLWSVLAFSTACRSDIRQESLGLSFSGPVETLLSEDESVFYILNSDHEMEYVNGNILTVDAATGAKLSSIDTPRLGRALARKGNYIIAGFDRSDTNTLPSVRLYDASGARFKHLKTWEKDDDQNLKCSPSAIESQEGSPYFFVSCLGGQLLVGEIKADVQQSTLKLVRTYGGTRRAVYHDVDQNLLFLFPTNTGSPGRGDLLTADKYTFDKEGVQTEVPNEVPDMYENSRFRRRTSAAQRRQFKVAIYDVTKAEREGFPFLEMSDDLEKAEMRFIYFTLNDSTGKPDTEKGSTDTTYKHYRSNFWKAQKSPFASGVFYLSHRAFEGEENKFGNNIVEVTLGNNVRTSLERGDLSPQMFTYKRVYGFDEYRSRALDLPFGFSVGDFAGQRMVVVNHFRDAVSFAGRTAFAITARPLTATDSWVGVVESSELYNGPGPFAIRSDGKILSCFFYGNRAGLFALKPGDKIEAGWDGLIDIR